MLVAEENDRKREPWLDGSKVVSKCDLAETTVVI